MMRALDRKTFRSGLRQIDAVVASITQLGEHVDAIVSSDDNRLSHGGGVSAAIWKAAGPELAHFVARAQPPLRLGQVFVSPAGSLDARAVLHAVSIDLDENRVIGPGQLGALFYRVLATADECAYRSIALPLIGSGVAGLDNAIVIKALEEALDAWFASPTALTRIVITVVGQSFESVCESVSRLVERGAIEQVFRRVEFNHRERYQTIVGSIEQTLSASSQTPFDARGPALAVLQELALRLLLTVLSEEGAGQSVSAPEKREPAMSGSAMLSEVHRLAPEGGIQMGPETYALLAQGIQARNRLVHASTQAWSPDDVMAVSLAAREALRLIPAPVEPPPPEEDTLVVANETRPAFSLVPETRSSDLASRHPAPSTADFVMPHLWKADAAPGAEDPWHAQSPFTGGLRRAPEGGTTHVRALRKRPIAYEPELQPISVRPSPGWRNSSNVSATCSFGFLQELLMTRRRETLFRSWEKLASSESLTTAGLGKLIVLAEVLDARLERDETAVARFFKGSVERRRLFPKDAADLANLRNSFIHYREREASEPYTRRLEAALRFLGAAKSFVDYLRAPGTRLFPLMVRITRIEFDAWARRRIHAIDDEGREELIFTDVPVEPGRVYIMQPLSNPVRVDPILVPAGDLVWPEAGRVR